MIRHETRSIPVNEATAAVEHYASVLYAIEITMLEDCNQGRGTSGIREAAELLGKVQHILERARGRMLHEHLRYGDAKTAAAIQTFRDLVRPGAIDDRARAWTPEVERTMPCQRAMLDDNP